MARPLGVELDGAIYRGISQATPSKTLSMTSGTAKCSSSADGPGGTSLWVQQDRPCRFSGPALRYGEPVGKQALIQEARPDPRFHDPRFQVMTPGFPGLGGRTGHQPASWAAIMELCRSVFADNNRCRADLTSSLRGRRIAAVIGNIETGICRSVYLMVRRIVSDIRRRRRSEP